MKKKIIFIILILVVILGCISIYFIRKSKSYDTYIDQVVLPDDMHYGDSGSILVASTDDDSIKIIEDYFANIGIRGYIVEHGVNRDPDATLICTNIVYTNIDNIETYYSIIDEETMKQYEAIILNGEVLYEELETW